MSDNHGVGPLRLILERSASEGYNLSELTVLAVQNDPYRFDNESGHRNGKWFAEVLERHVPRSRTVHLRGLHYLVSSVADIVRPDNGKLYTNTDQDWTWLSVTAAKAACWLGYILFERIVDERNAPPKLFVVDEVSDPFPFLYSGKGVELPS